MSTFTDKFIADTYTGVLHSEISFPSSGKVDIFDGIGNITALKLGVAGKGGSIDGDFTATTATIPQITSTDITSTTINGITINNTKLITSDISTASLNATGSVTSNAVVCTTLNSTSFNSEVGIVGSLTITSGALTVANITNTNLTSNYSAITNLDTTSHKNIGNITTDSLNVVTLLASGISTLNQVSCNRIVSGSLNAGNIEYPTSSTPKNLFDLIYPVGSVYLSIINTNPGTQFPGTTWVNTSQGLFLVGAGTGTDVNGVARGFNVGNNAGGEYQHTLTITEMPSHDHEGIIEIPAHTGMAGRLMTYLRSVIGVNTIPDHEGSGGAHEATQIDNTGDPTRDGSYSKIGGQVNLANRGGNGSHNSTPPSFGVYVWQRTA